MKTRLIQATFGLAVVCTLLVVLLSTTDIGAIVGAISGVNPALLVGGMAVHILAMWLRSVVWRRLLRPRPATATLFRASIIGFAINYLMPLRVGELVRAYLV